jgi:hypothetical protein
MHGRAWALHRARHIGNIVDPVVLARESGALPGEHRGDDLQRFGQPPGALGRRAPGQPGLRMFGADRTAAEPEFEPAPGDDVERGGHPPQQHRMPEIVAEHQGAHPQGGRRREQRGRGGPGLQGRVLGKSRRPQVVVQPQVVESGAFRSPGDIEQGREFRNDLRYIDAELHPPKPTARPPARGRYAPGPDHPIPAAPPVPTAPADPHTHGRHGCRAGRIGSRTGALWRRSGRSRIRPVRAARWRWPR